MSDSYTLIQAVRYENGLIKHEVMPEEVFKYLSVRIGLVWPTGENPAFFVAGGMETDDPLFLATHNVVRIIEEFEISDLSLNGLFGRLTDCYTSMLADVIYADYRSEDYLHRLWQYLDDKNLRTVSVQDVPYKNPILRFSTIKDFNDSGSLVIDKQSPLFQDLKGISRSHLKENLEADYYRLNALSYLISGFSKFPPIRKLKNPGGLEHSRRGYGWMGR